MKGGPNLLRRMVLAIMVAASLPAMAELAMPRYSGETPKPETRLNDDEAWSLVLAAANREKVNL